LNDPNDALDSPEDYLWVRHPDGHTTVIEEDRLHALQDGVAPEDEAEQLLVDNPQWLRIYLRHVINEHPITITLGTPLPQWDALWLEQMGI